MSCSGSFLCKHQEQRHLSATHSYTAVTHQPSRLATPDTGRPHATRALPLQSQELGQLGQIFR